MLLFVSPAQFHLAAVPGPAARTPPGAAPTTPHSVLARINPPKINVLIRSVQYKFLIATIRKDPTGSRRGPATFVRWRGGRIV